MTMLTSGFESGKRKKLLFIFIILLLVVGVGTVLLLKNNRKEPLTASQQSTLNQLGHDACTKNLNAVNKINADKVVSQDALELLNYRGNCYMELGKYSEAIAQYEEMDLLCKQINDNNCSVSAQDAIKIANSIKDSTQKPKTNPSPAGVSAP